MLVGRAFSFESLILLLIFTQELILLLAVASASRIHSFLDATLLHKVLFQPLQIAAHHLVGDVAERQSDIAELFRCPSHSIRFIVGKQVVFPAISQHAIVAAMMKIPLPQIA